MKRSWLFWFLLFVPFAWSGTTMASPPLSNSRHFHVDAPCSQVFPLFTARGEKAWAPGWNPEMLSGDITRGSVFRTRHAETETVWIVTGYQPDHYKVSYARIALGSNMGLVDVACDPDSGGSSVTVRYTLTGLNKEGDAFVREFLSDPHYTRFIEEWRTTITAALRAKDAAPR
jgi:hypothetical protein